MIVKDLLTKRQAVTEKQSIVDFCRAWPGIDAHARRDISRELLRHSPHIEVDRVMLKEAIRLVTTRRDYSLLQHVFEVFKDDEFEVCRAIDLKDPGVVQMFIDNNQLLRPQRLTEAIARATEIGADEILQILKDPLSEALTQFSLV